MSYFYHPLKKTSPIWRRKSKNLRLNKRHNKNFLQFFKNASRKLVHPPQPFQLPSPISTFNIWCSFSPPLLLSSSERMYQKFRFTNVKTLPLLSSPPTISNYTHSQKYSFFFPLYFFICTFNIFFFFFTRQSRKLRCLYAPLASSIIFLFYAGFFFQKYEYYKYEYVTIFYTFFSVLTLCFVSFFFIFHFFS